MLQKVKKTRTVHSACCEKLFLCMECMTGFLVVLAGKEERCPACNVPDGGAVCCLIYFQCRLHDYEPFPVTCSFKRSGHLELDLATSRVDARGSALGALPVLHELFLPSLCCSPCHILLCTRYSTFPVHQRPACFLDVVSAASDQSIHKAGSLTGADVVNLQEDLDKWLQQRQAWMFR